MNVKSVFIDANIIVYAHDLNEPIKRPQAMQLLRECWASPLPPSISIQVLQEVHVALMKKGLSLEKSAEIAREYLHWNVVENRQGIFQEALTLQGSQQLSFWDASILAAAKASGATELWSEDFQHGRDYEGVVVRNPFLDEAEDMV